MKLFLLTVGVLALSAFGYAQAPAPSFYKLFGNITAKSVTKDGDVFHIKGRIEINLGGFRVVADEADANTKTLDMELRGNVHLSPAAP